MVHYSEIAISPLEVPGEMSICIYISGCQNHCPECHYPELQQPNYGDPLLENISKIIEVYLLQATCVCFMGEGTCDDRDELIEASQVANKYGLKTCLYSGIESEISNWMERFHYIKIGAYQQVNGSLYEKTTNQRLYRKTESRYEDVTYLFWV